jgi:hypothetical protein
MRHRGSVIEGPGGRVRGFSRLPRERSHP